MSPFLCPGSGEDIANDPSVDVGQPEVAARVTVGEPGVVEPHHVEDRGVEVVDVNRVFGDLVAVFVGSSVALPPLDAAAGEEAGEAVTVMVAAARGQVLPGRAAKLGAADDQRVVEQARAAFRSLTNAASGWSSWRESLRWSSMLVWLSQLLFEPTSKSSMTRTPRSTRRRAIRHWAANDDRSPFVAP